MIKNEDELLSLARQGKSNAVDMLLNGYKYLVVSIARKYYLLGGEKDDLIQEGMIGLYNAIISFSKDKNDNFKNYAKRIVERSIISAIRKENSIKNRVLDESVVFDDLDIMSGNESPEADVISEERHKEFYSSIMKCLSPLEKKVVKLYLMGYSYKDISIVLKRQPKAIDNALTRIKNKLKYLKEQL